MKRRILTLSLTVFAISCLVSGGFAQTIEPVQIPLGEPKVVNFQERADYELIHPMHKKKRFVEQGEDREEHFKFKPKPVAPGAITFDVPAPTHQQRSAINSPAPSVSFNGVMDNSTLIPPDIRGAVGPNHVMQTTNQEFKIYSKAGSLISTVSITNFFSASGGSGYFDPHVLYDAVNGRWLVCIDGNVSNGHGGLFLAVSQTNNPTGSWYVYSFDAVGTTSDFIDYPLLGYNTNWVVITANDFVSSTSAVGKVYVFNRATVYSGSAGTISTFTDNNAFTLAPAQTVDNSQTTEYLVQDWNGNSSGYGYVQVCRITGTASAPTYTAGSTLGINQPWSESSVGAKQSGSTRTLESGDTRIGNAVYINGSLWFCQTAFLPASSPTRDAVQWWQINPATPAVQQFGRVDDATGANFYFYPSIAVNGNGDALLGYCQSSSTTFASASYALHASTDAANTMENGYLYKAGVANYYKTYGGSRNRWGDYTGAAVDPSDNSFWNFSEWANTSNLWATAVAHIPVTPAVPCDQVTGLTSSSIADNSATLSWTASANAVSYNVQYRAVGAASWTSASTTATSYPVAGLTAGTNYEWQVQTVCASGSSTYTASATFTTTGVAPCNTPSSLSTSGITTTTATFNWGAVSGAVSYVVQYRIVGAATWLTGTSSTTTYNATGLSATSNYEWQVQTVCSVTSSAFSASTLFTTATPSTCSDNYESNNTSGTAKTPPLNTNTTGFITPSTDVDWFKFTTTSSAPKVRVDLTTLPADYDVALYKSNASTRLAISQNGGTTSEVIKYNSSSSAATYYLKVYGYNGATSATNCYTLKVSTSSANFAPELNDAEELSTKETPLEIESALKLYPNPAKGSINVEYVSASDATVTLNVYNPTGQKLLSVTSKATEGVNLETINTETLSSGNYIFEIQNNGESQRSRFVIAK